MKFDFLWAKHVNANVKIKIAIKNFLSLNYIFLTMNFASFITSTETRKSYRKSIQRFECTSEALFDEPVDYISRGKSLFEKICRCEYDWKDAYCSNLDVYLNMDLHNSPKICICRCRCCFNQPDPYCRQLDCKNLHPDFGPNSNTSCICYDQFDYPRHLCSGYYSSAILPPETSPEPYLLKEYIPTTLASASILSSTTPSVLSTLKMKLDNSVVLALFIVLAAGIGIGLCFGCGVLIFGRVQANRKRRKKEYNRSIKEQKLLNAQTNDHQDQDVDNFLP